MSWSRHEVGRSQQGTVLLETALVVPLALLFVLAAADIGMWALDRTQAASSARDGARRGVLSYHQADISGSSDAIAVRDAVRRRLGKQAVITEIRCVGPSNTVALPGGCAAASVLSPDRIHVKVTWRRPSLSLVTEPFGAFQEINASALMSLNGLPTSVAAP